MGERKRKVNDGMDASPHSAGWGPDAARPQAGVGTTLREARQRRGVELRDVAETLRIRHVYLLAIEEGRYGDLPGTAYAAGFLRSYAEYLGIDADSIVRRFKEEMAGRARKQELYFPTPVPEERVPGGAVLLGALVLAGVVYGGWYYLSATDRSMVDLVPALPDRLVSLLDGLPFTSTATPPVGAGPEVAADPAPDNDAAAVPAAPADDRPPAVQPPTVTRTEPIPEAAPRPAAPAREVAAAPATPPAPAAGPAAPAPGGGSTTPSPATPPATPAPAAPPAPAVRAAPEPESRVAALPNATLPNAALPTVPPPEAEEEDSDGTLQGPTPLRPAAPVPPAVPAAPPAPAAAEGEAAGRVYGSQNQASRIQLRATADSWVQVRDGSGELLFTRVLRPGEVYRVPDRPGLRLRTGNAGGLVLVVDGVAGQPLGGNGQVLRDVALDAPAAR
nr:helix-turn-helix domain-containing protein [Azospirillum halopraeferens]